MEQTLQEFKNLGYTIQLPNKDKTLYLVKQFNDGTVKIFAKFYKKEIKIEAYYNYKKCDLSIEEEQLFNKLVEEMNLDRFTVEFKG